MSKPGITEEETEFASLPPMHMPELEEEAKSKGPRALLRRRHGKKMDRNKLRRDGRANAFFQS